MTIRILFTLDPALMDLVKSIAAGFTGNTNQLTRIEKELQRMNAAIEALQAKVAKNTEVTASAVTLIKGLAQQIRDAGTDPAKLNDLAMALDANSASLGAAVEENTTTA